MQSILSLVYIFWVHSLQNHGEEDNNMDVEEEEGGADEEEGDNEDEIQED